MSTATLPVDHSLPTFERHLIPVSAMRPGDVVRFGFERFVVSYPVTRSGRTGRLLFDTEGNGNSRELLSADDVTYPVERPVFTVEYRSDDRNGRMLNRVEHSSALDAVHCVTRCSIYDNLTLVAVGPNVNPSEFSL